MLIKYYYVAAHLIESVEGIGQQLETALCFRKYEKVVQRIIDFKIRCISYGKQDQTFHEAEETMYSAIYVNNY